MRDKFHLFVRGIPGSGKTILSKRICSNYLCNRINPDEIDFNTPEYIKFKKLQGTIFGNSYLKNINYRYNLKRASNYILDIRSFVWEQPWSNESGLTYTLNYLSSIDTFNPIIITLHTSIEIALKRVKNRYRLNELGLSPITFLENYINNFKPFISNLSFPSYIIESESNIMNIHQEMVNIVNSRNSTNFTYNPL